MTLNPFYITVFLYFIANLYTAIIGVYNNGINIEGGFFNISASSILISIIFQVVTLYFLSLFYNILKENKNTNTPILTNIWAYFLLLLQASFIFFNITNNLNIAGSGNTLKNQSIINILFILFQPDILYLLIGMYLRSNFLFWINTAIFTLSMTTRGWMGGIYIVFFVILTKYYPVRIPKKKIKSLLFLFIALILFLPNIIELKWAIRSGESVLHLLSNINIIDNIYSINTSFSYVINRFQHVGHISLFIDNMDFYYHEFLKSTFIPFWWEGLPQTIFLKLTSHEVVTLSQYSVSIFFNIDNPTWNINTGLVSWIFITQEYAPLLLIYLICFYILPLYYLRKSNNIMLFNLLSVFSIIYLFHGWFSAYFTLLTYIITFSLFLMIIRHNHLKSKNN